MNENCTDTILYCFPFVISYRNLNRVFWAACCYFSVVFISLKKLRYFDFHTGVYHSKGREHL